MRIKEIYPELPFDHEITSLTTNSKEVISGSVFIALAGQKHDGHDYIFEAITQGAKTIIYEKALSLTMPNNINFYRTHNAKKEVAKLASKFYHNLWDDLVIIGITGTNGKTTVSTLIYQYLTFLNQPSLLIGSNGSKYIDYYWPLVNTTPDILTIYRLVKLCKHNLKYVILEVSSQAIRELRILGIPFDVVAITNISQDHFDYHKTWDDYLFSKGLLLTQLRPNGLAIVKREMESFKFFDSLTINRIISFGKYVGDIKYNVKRLSLQGSTFTLVFQDEVIELSTPLVGEFNIENIACFYAIVKGLYLAVTMLANFLKDVSNIPGRMEQVNIKQRTIIIDYAHTPIAVSQVSSFLKKWTQGRLLIVLGCGGERDRTKRPLMLGNALTFGDLVYITEDNSRSEAFTQIVDDMLKGNNATHYQVIENREQAIQTAMENSQPLDIIAILGMGIDSYQYNGKTVTDFEIVKRIGDKLWKD